MPIDYAIIQRGKRFTLMVGENARFADELVFDGSVIYSGEIKDGNKDYMSRQFKTIDSFVISANFLGEAMINKLEKNLKKIKP